MATIEVDLSDLTGLLSDITDKADRNASLALSGSLIATANAAKRHAPQGSTSRLKKSIRPEGSSGKLSDGDLSGKVTADAPHAAAQEFGSGLHGARGQKYPILPRRRRALRWAVQGGISAGGEADAGFAFARGVMHPGVRPQRYMERALDETADDIAAELAAAVEHAVTRG